MSPAPAAPEAIPFAALRELPEDALRDLLGRCCTARAWVDAMTEAIRGSATRASGAPADRAELLLLSERCFDRLRREDWLEAFAGHPRIGDFESLRHRFGAAARLAAGEQAGARHASDRVLRTLAERNADYERRFGHIFIVCATGKSADEMLRLLDQRMANDPGVELAIASGEQRSITRLRIEALIAGAPARGGSQDR